MAINDVFMRPVGWCAGCGKYWYTQKSARALLTAFDQRIRSIAKLAASDSPANIPKRAYVCPESSDMWHLTKLASWPVEAAEAAEVVQEPLPPAVPRHFELPPPPAPLPPVPGIDSEWLVDWAAVVCRALEQQGDGLVWPSPSAGAERLGVREHAVRELGLLLIRHGVLSRWHGDQTVTTPFESFDPEPTYLRLEPEDLSLVREPLRVGRIADVVQHAAREQGGGLALPGSRKLMALFTLEKKSVCNGRLRAYHRGVLTLRGHSFITAGS